MRDPRGHFLIGLAVVLSAGAEALAPAGLVDPPWVAGAVDLLGILAGGWILLRRPSGATSAARGDA